MSYGFGPQNALTVFLASGFTLPDDEDEYTDAINTRENLTADAVNLREIAQYEQREVITGQQWFDPFPGGGSYNGPQTQNRTGYRFTIDLVMLNSGPIRAGATTLRIQPPLLGLTVPTKCFGAATIVGPTYVFFPSMFIDFTVNNANPNKQTLTITNNVGSDLMQCYATIEYLKQAS
jgi:hypothetical protein